MRRGLLPRFLPAPQFYNLADLTHCAVMAKGTCPGSCTGGSLGGRHVIQIYKKIALPNDMRGIQKGVSILLFKHTD